MLVNSNTCAWICEHPVDMRKSIDALAVLVEPLFNANPLSGHLFVFLCRHRIRIKILYWDRTGFALRYKSRAPTCQSNRCGVELHSLRTFSTDRS